MTLLSIVLALMLSTHASSNILTVLPTFLKKALEALRARFSTRWAAFLFVVPTAFTVLLIQWTLLQEAELLALLFSAFILSNCIDYGELVSSSKNLSIAFKARDARSIQTLSDSFGISDGDEALLQRALLEKSFPQLFLPLFWFAVLGPLGALLSKQLELMNDDRLTLSDGKHLNAPRLQQNFGWLPARCLVLSFALLTDFDAIMKRYRAVTEQPNISNKELARETAAAAIENSSAIEVEGSESIALSITKKILLLWLALFAVLTIGGWIL